jgi:tetratricopeptide (TPR) repeat protein
MGLRPNLPAQPTPLPAGGNRPGFNFPNRPGLGPTRPPTWPSRPGIGNRPVIDPRPGWPPGSGTRPSINPRPGWPPGSGIRPDWANRPFVPNRPGIIAGGGHNTIINRPNFGNNINIANINNNHFTNVRPWAGTHPWAAAHLNNWSGCWANHFNNLNHYHPWYHGCWNSNWNATGIAGPVNWGLGTWALNSTAYQFGYSNYTNPFYVAAPVVETVPALDYSQPFQQVANVMPLADDYDTSMAVTPPVDAQSVAPVAPPPPASVGVNDAGLQQFDGAREAFQVGDYRRALSEAEVALKQMPNDPLLHEFRALVLFALGEYKSAASALYSLLSVSPGWDWTTMSGFYADPAQYEQQLRELEQVRRTNPQAPELSFLLAYHYLAGGHPDAARTCLERLVTLMPNDPVATQLLEAVGGQAPPPAPPPAAAPPAAAPPAAAPAADVQLDIKGTWKAGRPDGGSVNLTMQDDGKFKWIAAGKGKTETIDGKFTLENDLLILERSAGGLLVGRVTPTTPNSFTFKLLGTPASDPGLTFQH